jgi:hypothetical protein
MAAASFRLDTRGGQAQAAVMSERLSRGSNAMTYAGIAWDRGRHEARTCSRRSGSNGFTR